MTFLYNITIIIYHILIRLSSVFSVKAGQFTEGRRNWRRELLKKTGNATGYIWFHCASLGEFEQGRPLIEAIRNRYPGRKILLTFFSPSGYEIRKNYPLADVVMYLPADTSSNARFFVGTVKPVMTIFIKYEFWNNYTRILQEYETPLYLVSAIFRDNQVFFSKAPWGRWYREILGRFTHLFVQDETSAALLRGIGITRYTISGDTRFDRVAAIASGSKPIPIVEKFIAGNPAIIAGSTWKPDEEIISGFIDSHPEIKFIIAPHEVDDTHINKLEQLLKTPSIRLSQTKENDISDCRVLIIDSIGMLSSLYRYGIIAYIGGGFGVGIHNILEAATFGLPVVFGPNYTRFREAREMVARGAAFPVKNESELKMTIGRLINNPEELKQASSMARQFVIESQGATEAILDFLFQEK